MGIWHPKRSRGLTDIKVLYVVTHFEITRFPMCTVSITVSPPAHMNS